MKSDPRWRISARDPSARRKKKEKTLNCQHLHPNRSKTHNRRCLRVATSRRKQTGNGEAKWNQLFQMAALTRLWGGDRASKEGWVCRWGGFSLVGLWGSHSASWSLSPCSFNYRADTSSTQGRCRRGGRELYFGKLAAAVTKCSWCSFTVDHRHDYCTTMTFGWQGGGHQTLGVIIRAVCSAPHSAVCIHGWGYGAET